MQAFLLLGRAACVVERGYAGGDNGDGGACLTLQRQFIFNGDLGNPIGAKLFGTLLEFGERVGFALLECGLHRFVACP
jgi:hypothetical protein